MPTYNPDCMEVLVADISMRQPIGSKGTCQGRLPYNLKVFLFFFFNVLSHSVVSNSLGPHGL